MSTSLTAALLLDATRIHRDFAAVLERSRDLLWLVRRRRTTTGFHLPRLAGGSDAGLLADMIRDTAMCLDCLAQKSGMPAEQVEGGLRALGRSLRLTTGRCPCAACLRRTTTFCIVANGNSAPRPDGQTQAVILQFLEEHRGQAFCSSCLSVRLFGGRNVDIPLRQLEGRPAVGRQHGPCSACMKTRLVTTVP